MKLKAAIISAAVSLLLPIVSFAYDSDAVLKSVVVPGHQVSLSKSFPVEKVTIKDAVGNAKNVNLAGARDIASNGREVVVTGDSGTHLLDMSGNIILGIIEKGKLVAIDDYIAVSDNSSVLIFNKSGIIVCQRTFPGFVIKSISIKGNKCTTSGSYLNGAIAERGFAITEDALVEIK